MNVASKNGLLFGLLMPGDLRAREEWETVWEGTPDLYKNKSILYNPLREVECNGWKADILFNQEKMYIFNGDTLRVTVDGTSVIWQVSYVPNDYGWTDWVYAGNLWLMHDGDDYPDTGEDFLVYQTEDKGALTGYRCWMDFHTRTPGTYNVKIERLVN